MYAIVCSGGKQYKAEQGRYILVEKVDAEIGEKIKLDVVMLSNDGEVLVGSSLANVVVEAEVLQHDKASKIIVYKYKSKKNERKRQGHRQPFTKLKIVSIQA